MFCKNCGATLPENTKFCTGCGENNEKPAAIPQPAQQPQGAYTPSQQQNRQLQQQQHHAQQQFAQQPPQQRPPQQYAQQPPQQYAQQQYAQYPPPQYATQSAAPKKRGGGILAYRIIAAILVVAMTASAVFGVMRNRDETNGETASGNPDMEANGDGETGRFGGEEWVMSEEADELLIYLDSIWEDDRSTWLDASTLTREFIETAAVQPSDQSTTMELSGLSLTIPGGFSETPLDVTLSEVTDMPPVNGFFHGKVYDLDIGGKTELPDKIAVTMPYEPSVIESPEDLYPMVWDAKMGWISCPFSVDENALTVTMYTDHLCPIVLGYIASAWAYTKAMDLVFEAAKTAHDAYTIICAETETTSKGNFTIRYNPYELWRTIDRESYDRDVKAANQSERIPIPEDIQGNIKSGLSRLGAMLETKLDVYDNAGYKMGSSAFSYPVTVGMGGDAHRSSVAAAISFMYLTAEEFVLFATPDASVSAAEQKLQTTMFMALLGSVNTVENFLKDVNIGLFGTIRPFAMLGDAEFWLNGLYGYVPYSLFVSSDTSAFTQIVSDKFLSKPIENLSNNEATLVPYFIQKVLNMPLSVVVADAVTNKGGGATAAKIAKACGDMSREDWYYQFVDFIYTKTTFCQGGNYDKDMITITTDVGRSYYLEYDTEYAYDKLLYPLDGAGISDEVITVGGTGYVDLALVVFDSNNNEGITVNLKDKATDEIIYELYTRGSGNWSTEIYIFQFNVDWSITPDTLEMEDPDNEYGYEIFEFNVAYVAATIRTVRFDIIASIDGTNVLESKGESISTGDKLTFNFVIPDDLESTPRELLVEIFNPSTKALLASKIIAFPVLAPTLEEIEGYYADGVLIVTEINMGQAYTSAMEAAGAAEALTESGEVGCDPAMVQAMLQESIGQENPVPFTIKKTGVNSGTLEFSSDDPTDSMDTLDLTYANGVIRASTTVTEEGSTTAMTLEITAAYGSGNDSIVLDGIISAVISMSTPEFSGEIFTLKITITGTKPLG